MVINEERVGCRRQTWCQRFALDLSSVTLLRSRERILRIPAISILSILQYSTTGAKPLDCLRNELLAESHYEIHNSLEAVAKQSFCIVPPTHVHKILQQGS